MPIYAEQPYTANVIAKAGIGRVLQKFSVTGEQMLDQAREVNATHKACFFK
jgi:UDP:flavonoid glycosyltransferase YjiC (YdhE family)